MQAFGALFFLFIFLFNKFFFQFLEWCGLEVTASALVDECKDRGWPSLNSPTASSWRKSQKNSTCDTDLDASCDLPPLALELVKDFDNGHAAKFFEVII